MKEKISGTGLRKKHRRTSQEDSPKEQLSEGLADQEVKPSKITRRSLVIVLIRGKPRIVIIYLTKVSTRGTKAAFLHSELQMCTLLRSVLRWKKIRGQVRRLKHGVPWACLVQERQRMLGACVAQLDSAQWCLRFLSSTTVTLPKLIP